MVNNDVLIDLLRGKFSDKPGLQFEQYEKNESVLTDRVRMSYENTNETWPVSSFDCEAMVSVARATGFSFLIGYNTEEHIVAVNYYSYGK